jgi:hypothetical protein
MKILLIVLGVICGVWFVVALALCSAAGAADRVIEAMYNDGEE